MAYSKENVIAAVLGVKDYLYKNLFVNYSGKIKGGVEKYTEVVAGQLLQSDLLKGIGELKREQCYRVKHSIENRKKGSNRHEELFASRLKEEGRELKYLGRVIDFQVPLKPANTKIYNGVGKIDLLSLVKRGSTAYIIELKYGNNKETLLRAILEIVYYDQWLSKEKFLADFKEELGDIRPKDIKKAVLLGDGTRSRKEAEDLKNRPNLRKLIVDLGVDVFLIDKNMNVRLIKT